MGNVYDMVVLDIVSAHCPSWYRYFREHRNGHQTLCDWFVVKSGIRSSLSEVSSFFVRRASF